MRITLCTAEIHEELLKIQTDHPELTLQNNGYEYIVESKLSDGTLAARDRVVEILKDHVEGFCKFFNFKIRKDGSVVMRFDFAWDPSFVGVGYLKVDELMHGFKEGQTQG